MKCAIFSSFDLGSGCVKIIILVLEVTVLERWLFIGCDQLLSRGSFSFRSYVMVNEKKT